MPRPDLLQGESRRIKTCCGNLYVTINHENGKLKEVFLTMGKSGTCARSMCEMTGRLLSIAINKDADIRKIIKSIKGIRCGSANGDYISCSDAICQALEKFLEGKNEKQERVPD
jgi:ribonucleoside-diphosphate reductase alpha chain